MTGAVSRLLPRNEWGLSHFPQVSELVCQALRACLRIKWAGPQLFRIKPERLELPAPLGRWISEPLDTDAAGQAAFDGCFDKISARKVGESRGCAVCDRLLYLDSFR
jgi:hypothetical protein